MSVFGGGEGGGGGDTVNNRQVFNITFGLDLTPITLHTVSE